MACEGDIRRLRRDFEAAEKRYRDLRDEKESLVNQQVGFNV